jgi:hypothetical protein
MQSFKRVPIIKIKFFDCFILLIYYLYNILDLCFILEVIAKNLHSYNK